MGVKDLWTILSPVCERKSLYELQGKSIAVDLSCWVVEGQSVAEYSSQPRMYLRNLFFRTTCLLMLGVKPIFVLEGSAPTLKHDIMAKRNEIQSRNHRKNTQTQSQQSASSQSSQSSQRNGKKGGRSRLKSLSKQCEKMLRTMGVCCIQSSGEAEALCAQLNELGLVDGCITQDGDCFLYGATTVYRNFTVSAQGSSSSSGYSVDVYKMADVERKLRLTREKLVALSLVCGCDYGPGVGGAGKQLARTFLDCLDDDVPVLERLQRWRTDPYFERLERERAVLTTASLCDNCCHPGKANKHETAGCRECGRDRGCRDNLLQRVLTGKDPQDRKVIIAELNLRKKALTDPDFPSQEMIDEFLQKRPKPNDLDLDWKEPDLAQFVKLAVSLLSWTDTYAVEKFLPLVARWQLGARAPGPPLSPARVVKTRVQRGVACYEIRWRDHRDVLSTLTLDEGVTGDDLLVTVEPRELVARAYPLVVEAFEAEVEAAKKAKRKPRATKKTKALAEQDTLNVDKPSQKEPLKQLSLNQFVHRPLPPTKPPGHVTDVDTVSQTRTHPIDSQQENIGATKTRKKRATSPKNKAKGNATQKRPQVTIASLMRKVQTIEKSKALNHRVNDIVCNAVNDIDNIVVTSSVKNTTNVGQTCAKRYGSPGMKAGLKDRKITRHSSTPKKSALTMYHLESSFKSMSLVDDLEDLDSNDDISNLSALIDSIVGFKDNTRAVADVLRQDSTTSRASQPNDVNKGRRTTADITSETNENIGAKTAHCEELPRRRSSADENYAAFRFELVRGRDRASSLDRSFRSESGDVERGSNGDYLMSESIAREFERDEFDISTEDYVPLWQRIQTQSS